MEHPYPDHAYLEVDSETNEKRWFSIKGMGVTYVHEDRAMEDIEAAVKAEREACASLISTGEFCRHVEHVQGHCDCGDMAAAIRART